ncbi:MAG: alpha-mannosidase [Candidatus Hermodarchaeota archaeon]
MKANHIIIVPETHWDREWYLPFQEFRAKLVLLMDKLLEILREDPNYANFTLDGQTIPLEDYLEVRPEARDEIVKYVKEKRLSIGPMYILPDEFLVSGESLIRNLLIGHQIARKFGRVMKAGYIPDPFGHIAQLPQILQGFEIPSVLFMRGFGNEFEDLNLNIEFNWISPGKASSILAIFLIFGYGSVANLKLSKKTGVYKLAINKIKRVVANFEKYTATPYVLLNSGEDHHEAKPEIPEIVKQWNENYPNELLEQNDFEYYVDKVLSVKPKLKTFQGELRGGKYHNLLSGVFSARMWIKQRNTAIEYLFEKYVEPFATITWALDKHKKFKYPRAYITAGLKWLIKNHPHDSICGCSIDPVHAEMKTRFDWAEQIGNEIFKNSILYFHDLLNTYEDDKKVLLIVFNPLPWKRRDMVNFNLLSNSKKFGFKNPEKFRILDSDGNDIPYQYAQVEGEPRYRLVNSINYYCSFLADVPASGYNCYYLVAGENYSDKEIEDNGLHLGKNFIENNYYRVDVSLKGQITVLDKSSGILYEKICSFEDVGDWGDEYDFSGPFENQTDIKFTSEDLNVLEIIPVMDGITQKSIKMRANLNLPASLTEDRYTRDGYLISNLIDVTISLYQDIKRIDFKIELDNTSKDHRIQVKFPTKVKAQSVNCDGHFYVIPRDIKLPVAEKWTQKPLPTNHQKDFISVSDEHRTFSVINKGLPEYEAVVNKDGTVCLAITLLRCIEWLQRSDFASRRMPAGPDLYTPEAQCLGTHKFELSLSIEENKISWLSSQIHVKGKEFNNPLKLIAPAIVRSPSRSAKDLVLSPFGILSVFTDTKRYQSDSYLPASLSFLEIENSNIVLSALKKSEEDNDLIIRCFNISPEQQKTKIKLCDFIEIHSAQIVNFLEEKPQNEIKAKIYSSDKHSIEIEIDPHVIVTIKLNLSFVK